MHRPEDRRRYPRAPMSLPVRLRIEGMGAGRFLCGHTMDLSAGGAMVRVEAGQGDLLTPGEVVRVAVVSHVQATVPTRAMLSATVARSTRCGDVQHAALRFDRPRVMAAAG